MEREIRKREERIARLAPARYGVADLTVDLGRQQVVRNGEEIALPKLSFDLLVALIRAAPNLARLDALMSEVWPGVVVSPETLSQRVKLLRDALSDDPREPRYVAGLRGRGYRLIPPVKLLAEGAETAREQAVTSREGEGALPASPEAAAAAGVLTIEGGRAAAAQPRSWRRPLGIALGFVAVLAIGAGAYALLRALSAAPTEVVVRAPRTVAVLPFDSLSPDANDAYLAPGIAEMVQNRLASRTDLVVIASTSSFAVRERETDLRAIGRRLGARFLVDGSVHRAGPRLRVTAQIIEAESAQQLRALQFDRELDDLLAIEDEIADGVAEALALTLDPNGAKPAEAPANLDAHLAYLQGRRLLARYRASDAKAAIAKFRQAAALDPSSPLALVGEAEARKRYAWLAQDDESAAAEEALRLIDRALEIDPHLGEAIILRAYFDEDVAGIRRGLELAPSFGEGWEHLAEAYWSSQRAGDAMLAIDRARMVDPLSPRNHYLKGLYHMNGGELDVARALFATALEVDPEFLPALTRLAVLDAREGRFAQAVKGVEGALALDPATRWVHDMAAYAYLRLGDVAAARDAVAGLPARAVRVRIALHEGDVRGAAQIAAEVARHEVESEGGGSPFVEALRDEGLRSGNLQLALERIDEIAAYEEQGPSPETRLARAQLLLRSGARARAEQEIAAALAWLDERRVTISKAYSALIRSSAYALRGDRPGAFAAISGWSEALTFEWYALERDPIFDALRDDPRFAALRERFRAHVTRERAELERMRERGEVPRRPAPRPPAPRAASR